MFSKYDITPLSVDSLYYIAYSNAKCKGDDAIQLFGKSDGDESNDYWWHSIKKEYLPWRGGTIITGKGTFCWCVHMSLWRNQEQTPGRLLYKILNDKSINNSCNNSIYFWKSQGEFSTRNPPEPSTEATPEAIPEATTEVKTEVKTEVTPEATIEVTPEVKVEVIGPKYRGLKLVSRKHLKKSNKI